MQVRCVNHTMGKVLSDIFILSTLHDISIDLFFVDLVIRWLAELETGDEDNTWIVNKLIELYRMRSTEEPYDAILPLGVSHFNDQWWIGAKSYVSWHE